MWLTWVISTKEPKKLCGWVLLAGFPPFKWLKPRPYNYNLIQANDLCLVLSLQPPFYSILDTFHATHVAPLPPDHPFYPQRNPNRSEVHQSTFNVQKRHGCRA